MEYDKLLETTLKRWKSVSSLLGFHNYFIKQSIKSDFNNCQVFKTTPGFSKTNNPMEQNNYRIKVDITKRIKLHLKSTLKVFRELIGYESQYLKEILILSKISKLLKEARKSISE